MREEEGHTLVEIAAAMAVTGLVLALIFAAFANVLRYISTWSDRVSLEDSVNLLVQVVSRDVSDASALELSGNSWHAVLSDEGSVEYAVSSREVRRNGIIVLTADSLHASLAPCGDDSIGSDLEMLLCFSVAAWEGRDKPVIRTTSFFSRQTSSWPRMNQGIGRGAFSIVNDVSHE